MRERALLGVQHPLATVERLEEQLAYRFPIVGGLYYTFDSHWALHTRDYLPARGRQLVVTWMLQSVARPVVLADIARGRWDAEIDQMLHGMRAWNGQLVVRLGHEMNGNWYPWSAAYRSPDGARSPDGVRSPEEVGASNSPDDFVTAWTYVVHRERGLPGASNIRWFWCANGADLPAPDGHTYPLEDYWPGADLVDIAGCDVFNEPTTWDSFDAIVAPPYARITALSADRPFWIGETGCHEPLPGQPGTKAQWLRGMLDTRRFPRLEALCYFDYDAAPQGRADWRFASSPATLRSVITDFRSVPPRA